MLVSLAAVDSKLLKEENLQQQPTQHTPQLRPTIKNVERFLFNRGCENERLMSESGFS